MSSGIRINVQADSVIIPVSEVEGIWKFNKFADVTKDANSLQPLHLYSCSGASNRINASAVDYSKLTDMSKRTRLKSDWFKIRLVSTKNTRFKKIFKWILNKQIKTNR